MCCSNHYDSLYSTFKVKQLQHLPGNDQDQKPYFVGSESIPMVGGFGLDMFGFPIGQGVSSNKGVGQDSISLGVGSSSVFSGMSSSLWDCLSQSIYSGNEDSSSSVDVATTTSSPSQAGHTGSSTESGTGSLASTTTASIHINSTETAAAETVVLVASPPAVPASVGGSTGGTSSVTANRAPIGSDTVVASSGNNTQGSFQSVYDLVNDTLSYWRNRNTAGTDYVCDGNNNMDVGEARSGGTNAGTNHRRRDPPRE